MLKTFIVRKGSEVVLHVFKDFEISARDQEEAEERAVEMIIEGDGLTESKYTNVKVEEGIL